MESTQSLFQKSGFAGDLSQAAFKQTISTPSNKSTQSNACGGGKKKKKK